jgi:DNA-binding transcriptional MerR regulator
VNPAHSRPESTWSIDELAQLVGLPTRTIREYRTLGLLEPPHKRGRVGVYDIGHRDRLERISRMQQRGYSLAGIRDLLNAVQTGETLESLIGDSGLDEPARELTDEQLVAIAPWLDNDDHRAAAIEAGVIHRSASATWHTRAPSLLTLLTEAVAAGATPAAVLAAASAARSGARQQADALASLFVDELWPTSDPASLTTLGRRARVLASRAAAALIVDELADALRTRAHADGDELLGRFVDSMGSRR